jgi:PPK2 family polyphosphate:nucleotide phosphotransferase
MSLRDVLRIDPGTRADLSSIDPGGTPGLPRRKSVGKRWGRAQLDVLGLELASLQERLFATAKITGSRRRVLLVLQAMDCGGKDGTVRKVAGTMNPQGLTVTGFGKPTAEELSHDFLWRITRALPVAGQVAVFNRSHYEDVLVARVHKLVPRRTWRARYRKINEFEAAQAADGTTIIKVMLHISPDEQLKRLAERLVDPTRHWKYNPHDIEERALWGDYQAAYADALSACSTSAAPWYVVPADRKWYRDWAVATLLRDTMADLDLHYPPADFDVATERARLR